MIFVFVFFIDLILMFFAVVLGGVGLGLTVSYRRQGPHGAPLRLLVSSEVVVFVVTFLISAGVFEGNPILTTTATLGGLALIILAVAGLVVGLRQVKSDRRLDLRFGYSLLAVGLLCLALALGTFAWSVYTINTYCPTHSAGCA